MAVKNYCVNACKTMFTEYLDVVGIKEICRMLGIGRDKAYQLVNTGELIKIPCSRSIKVQKVSVYLLINVVELLEKISSMCYNSIKFY